jgi:hypothetical protein
MENKTYLALIRVDKAGRIIEVLSQEEKTPEQFIEFFEYHQALEQEHAIQKNQSDTLWEMYKSLKNYHDSTTHRNEMALNALISVLTTQGIYDPKKHSMDLSPLFGPYMDKYMAEREAKLQKLNFIEDWWENFKIKRGLKWGNLLMGGFGKASKFFMGMFSKKKANV